VDWHRWVTIMLSVKIESPDVDREIKRLSDIGGDFTPALKAGGKQLETDLRDHFAARNQEPNKEGWPKRNFWAGIRRSTALSSFSASEAVVLISDPAINQKVYGGTITPKRVRNLPLPMNADAYRAGSPRELQTNFLRLIVTRSGAYLVEREAVNIRPRGGKKVGYRPASEMGGRFWYHLVPSVTQQPDPRALPDESYLEGSVLAAIRGVLDAEILSASGGSA